MTSPSNNLQKAKSAVYDSKKKQTSGLRHQAAVWNQWGPAGLLCFDAGIQPENPRMWASGYVWFPLTYTEGIWVPQNKAKIEQVLCFRPQRIPWTRLTETKQRKTTLSEQVIFTAESQDTCSGFFFFLQRKHVHFKVITVSLRLETMSTPLYIQSQNKAFPPPLTCLFWEKQAAYPEAIDK